MSSTPDGIVDSYPWSSSSLDDTLWAGALEADSGERFSTLQPVSVDPRLLETRPTAKWIAAREGGAKQVSFAYNVNLPFVRGETWLQVAATGAYDVTINGRPAAVWTVQAQAQLAKAWLFIRASRGVRSCKCCKRPSKGTKAFGLCSSCT